MDAICEERGSDWSYQVSAVGTTRWLQRDQTLPLFAKGVACKTRSSDGVTWHNALWKLGQNEEERGKRTMILFAVERSWSALGWLFLFLSAQLCLIGHTF